MGMKKKKIIVYSCLLIIFFACGYEISQFVPKKIYNTEVQREKTDLENLQSIRNNMLDAINNDEEARKWVRSVLGNNKSMKIYIGKSDKFEFQEIKDKCKPLYNAMNGDTFNDVSFISEVNSNSYNYIKLYINDDYDVSIYIEDMYNNQVKCKYVESDMKAGN